MKIYEVLLNTKAYLLVTLYVEIKCGKNSQSNVKDE